MESGSEPQPFLPYVWWLLRSKGKEEAEGCFLARALTKVNRGMAITGKNQRWAPSGRRKCLHQALASQGKGQGP